ncbi:MAG: tetratricopeptide repeat protein [Rhodothermaceae bacterium]|nr:tetratricopeptide repeat protein [Rhodothermaceae bacterium]
MSDARIAQLKAFLVEDPHDNFTLFALALEYIKMGDAGQAEKLFKSILANDPAYVGVYYHLGKLYESLGDIGMARSTYIEGIAVTRKAGELHALSELETALGECGDS